MVTYIEIPASNKAVLETHFEFCRATVEVQKWLNSNIGIMFDHDNFEVWKWGRMYDYPIGRQIFFFKEKKDAVLFKLVYG